MLEFSRGGKTILTPLPLLPNFRRKEPTMKKDYYNYIVHSNGMVYSKFSQKNLKPSKDKNGYEKVVLYILGKRVDMRVHRLVAICFIENKNNKPEVNHIDGNKENNNFSNLEWCTNIENVRHSISNGLKYKNITKEEMIKKNKESQIKRYSKMSDIEKEKNGICGIKNKAFGKNYIKNKTVEEKKIIAEKKRITSLKNCNFHLNKNGTAIIIDGIEYKSINNASLILKQSFKYIKRRITSKDYKNYYFKEECR